MTFQEALAATVGTRRIARPTTGLRDGCGFYVGDNGRIIWHDPTALAGDLRSVLVLRADWWPEWETLAGEWEVVGR